MDTTIQEDLKADPHHKSLVVKVRYIAARRQYVDSHASPEETLAGLKPKVLEFFGLVEGGVEGGKKTYQFVLHNEVLSDLSVTLESIASDKKGVDLLLVERFEQG